MACRLRHLLIAALALGLFAAAADAAELIVVVRHAEREVGSGDDGLSAAGKARAEKLVFVLEDVGITHVLTSERRRTIETAGPLARARGVQPQTVPIGEGSADQQVAATVAAIQQLPADARVLVVGHSNTVPRILAALGVSAPITIPETVFDDLFILAPRAGEPPVLTRLRY